ncbi:MAG: tetratricopeptide repeat protein [Pirellulaceae bacterium]
MPHLPHTAYFKPAIFRVFVFLASCSVLTSDTVAQQGDGPMIARLEMRLAIDDKVVDIIHKGDMVNVSEERPDGYVISTMSGARGIVEKANLLKLAEAVEVYTELIESEPKVGQYYTLRASSLWARGENEKALADYDRAIELGYAEPHAFSSRGLFHAAMGNFSEAIADYTTAIEKQKKAGDDDESPYLNRAAVYVTQKKPDLAIADYNAAIQLKPRNASIHQQRAVAYKMAGRFEEAILDFERAVELQPTNTAAWMGRGFLWFQLDEHQKAIADFSRVIELEPNTAAAYNNRGFNYKEIGEWEKALADYDKALELFPKYALALQNKAWLLTTCTDKQLRNATQAISAARLACELNNFNHVPDLMTLAAALAESGNFKEAIGWQEKVIEMTEGEQKKFAEKVYAAYKQEQTFDVIQEETVEP